RRRLCSPLFPYTTLFRSDRALILAVARGNIVQGKRDRDPCDRNAGPLVYQRLQRDRGIVLVDAVLIGEPVELDDRRVADVEGGIDRKSTRLNSSHVKSSY